MQEGEGIQDRFFLRLDPVPPRAREVDSEYKVFLFMEDIMAPNMSASILSWNMILCRSGSSPA